MKILMIHNEYAAISGEEIEFYGIASLLRKRGHMVELYTRSSAEIERMKIGKARAFFAGIYNPFSVKHINRIINSFNPDVAFIQNLFPLISPAVLSALRRAGIPVVMRVANYRMMCPNGLHMHDGKVCERCKNGREYWCFLLNCENNFFKSAGYALRSYIARLSGWYKNNISAYLCAARFLNDRLVEAGFEPKRIHIVPNLMPDKIPSDNLLSKDDDEYVGYVGRISREKGVHVLLDAASKCPDIPFRIAGKVNQSFCLPDPLPQNVKLTGFLKNDELHDFYNGARLLVSASICFETFGISVAEAMLHSKPIIVSRIGVFPEFVQDGLTGLLSEPGNAEDLSNKIRYLWEHPELCHKIGKAGREKVVKEYAPELYYKRLMTVFEKVVKSGHNSLSK
jgi:glycosyltransferase involved in cell wall biosynthesis